MPEWKSLMLTTSTTAAFTASFCAKRERERETSEFWTCIPVERETEREWDEKRERERERGG